MESPKPLSKAAEAPRHPLNILYILGAGASVNALPIVNSFRDDTDNIRMGLTDELIAFTDIVKGDVNLSKYYILCNNAKDFITPDTFAKFLFVTGRRAEYNDLKIVLSAFFLFKEKIEILPIPCVDKRMLSFLTTLMEENGLFPKNVKLLSWNYDNQFYIASQRFTNTKNGVSLLNTFRSFPFSRDSTIDKLSLNFAHLNGIAGFVFDNKSSAIVNKLQSMGVSFNMLFEKLRGLNRNQQIKELLSIFSDGDEEILISFAWERENEAMPASKLVSERIDTAKALARGTDILVVIGYSFPFFNREIDKEIFDQMTLKKIYFQDPQLDGNYLRAQFRLDEKVIIENIKDVRNYYIPYEL